MEEVLPNIPVKIIRMGSKLRIQAGDFILRVGEIPGKPNQYPLLVIDKFITEATTVLLKKEIEEAQNREAIKKALPEMGLDPAESTDMIMRRIHDDMWGEQ